MIAKNCAATAAMFARNAKKFGSKLRLRGRRNVLRADNSSTATLFLSTGLISMGLSSAVAEKRLREEGFNELPSGKRRTLSKIFLEAIREPMILLLLACGLVYLLLGDRQEAVILLISVWFVVGIELYQTHKTERTLLALRNMASPRALVIRDGIQKRIPGREVVREDIVILSEGDRVPADSFLLTASALFADESMLTGESAPVFKQSWDGRSPFGRPGAESGGFVYSGTLIVRGHALARVQAVGAQTEMGRIGKSLNKLVSETPLLQKKMNRLIRVVAVIGLSLCLILILAQGLLRGRWVEGLLSGLALAMSLIPEEFPVILTIFLALGAWRIAQKKVLARRLSAIESLGSATVLCVDKTGTLTLNRMRVGFLWSRGKTWIDGKDNAAPELFRELLRIGLLASRPNPTDPMEKALAALFEKELSDPYAGWMLKEEFPLTKNLLVMGMRWQPVDSGPDCLAAKGAPEAVLAQSNLLDGEKAEIESQVEEWARRGYRLLAAARAEIPAGQPVVLAQARWEFTGLLGFIDPVRETVPEAIRECHRAGIRVVMITGDYPGTALGIARQVGLPADKCLTGAELERMSPQQFRQAARETNIFARVLPEQKLHLVTALKADKQVVAMTGDGVNDAPALKAAHIGIAMGGRGTDVAREAAELVLLDDAFESIVSAIRMGRRIFDNLRKATAYILAVHIPIAGLSLLPVFFGWPPILFPVHIVFLELVIDPSCSIVFEQEPEEPTVMDRPPRPVRAPILTRGAVFFSLIQGTTVLAAALVIYAIHRGNSEFYARTMAVTVTVIANLALVWSNRSLRPLRGSWRERFNPAYWIVSAVTVLAWLGILSSPFFRRLFHFAQISWKEWAWVFVLEIAIVLWFESIKRLFRGKTKVLKPSHN